MEQRLDYGRIFRDISLRGLSLGAVYGAVFGTFLMPILGTVYGLFYGGITGAILGPINGVLILLLTFWFGRGDDRLHYVQWCAVSSAFLTYVGSLNVLAALLNVRGPEYTGYVLIPALIAAFCASWASVGVAVHTAYEGEYGRPKVKKSSPYEPDYVRRLFNEMEYSYERVSTVTSFGFNHRWRKQLIDRLPLETGMRVCDLMCGGGEVWRYVLPRIGKSGELYAVDFSQAMTRSAERRKAQLGNNSIMVLREDVLNNSIPAGSADAVVCAYGLKTLAPEDHAEFVRAVSRLLREGGVFGAVEVSVPPVMLLRLPYLFYLRWIVPLVGWVFIGNPLNYRLLSVYTQQFGDCSRLAALFEQYGFEVEMHSLFYGCATAITGVKRG